MSTAPALSAHIAREDAAYAAYREARALLLSLPDDAARAEVLRLLRTTFAPTTPGTSAAPTPSAIAGTGPERVLEALAAHPEGLATPEIERLAGLTKGTGREVMKRLRGRVERAERAGRVQVWKLARQVQGAKG